jgi:uncharacterized membrane protein
MPSGHKTATAFEEEVGDWRDRQFLPFVVGVVVGSAVVVIVDCCGKGRMSITRFPYCATHLFCSNSVMTVCTASALLLLLLRLLLLDEDRTSISTMAMRGLATMFRSFISWTSLMASSCKDPEISLLLHCCC